MNKYRNKKVVIDGITFHSKKEGARYCELKLLVRSGAIKDLRLQPKFELQPEYKKNGKTIRALNYIADFIYFDCKKDKVIIEDVKGIKTKEYKIKKKIFEYINSPYEILET